ncbi:MAG: cell wall hydrolase [Shewanella oncorhynchi]
MALALNLFFEARGEGEAGMRAVADTVITRVESPSYPDNVVGVVLQRKQFSWANSLSERSIFGLMSKQGEALRINPEAYRKAERVARMALDKGHKKRPFIHFHSVKIKPYWAKSMLGHRIGNHIFYKGKS